MLPTAFDIIPGSTFFPPLPLPPACPNFLQVGMNVTQFQSVGYDFPELAPVIACGFYTWNNITTKIKGAEGVLVSTGPLETIVVTLTATATGADVIYNSTAHGLFEFSLEGELCQNYTLWALGKRHSTNKIT